MKGNRFPIRSRSAVISSPFSSERIKAVAREQLLRQPGFFVELDSVPSQREV
uniref:Uncharacterized protein n=1 Tax=Anguilla anguilla TaxID=7936 RepID=A0A0E9WUZ0_ANGAN